MYIQKIYKYALRIFDYKKEFSKTSYSQSGEDLIVKYIFDSMGIKKPSYIDIGAHHPYYINNTAIFYRQGSRGINIEPDYDLFKKFIKYRKEDININAGVADNDGTLDFYVMSTPTLNSFSKEGAESAAKEGYKIKEVKKIPVLPIKTIVDKYANGIFPDFLSLDAEGFDLEILRSINFESNSPVVICVETISFSENGKGKKDNSIADVLSQKGYMVYADTHINTLFVKKDKWENRR